MLTGHAVALEAVRVIAGVVPEATQDLEVDRVIVLDRDPDLGKEAGADHAAAIKILDLDHAVVPHLKRMGTPQRKIRTNVVSFHLIVFFRCVFEFIFVFN